MTSLTTKIPCPLSEPAKPCTRLKVKCFECFPSAHLDCFYLRTRSIKMPFLLKGHNEGTIAMAEGELLYVIEEDKGDGWTRVRRNQDEEGYVPTSYVEVFLETNAKGAMTYI